MSLVCIEKCCGSFHLVVTLKQQTGVSASPQMWQRAKNGPLHWRQLWGVCSEKRPVLDPDLSTVDAGVPDALSRLFTSCLFLVSACYHNVDGCWCQLSYVLRVWLEWAAPTWEWLIGDPEYMTSAMFRLFSSQRERAKFPGDGPSNFVDVPMFCFFHLTGTYGSSYCLWTLKNRGRIFHRASPAQ